MRNTFTLDLYRFISQYRGGEKRENEIATTFTYIINNTRTWYKIRQYSYILFFFAYEESVFPSESQIIARHATFRDVLFRRITRRNAGRVVPFKTTSSITT